ncbi:GNAT family N-acetyltransferase [Vibrio sp. PP-XX7]
MMFDLSETVALDYEGQLIGTACAAVQGDFASVGLIVVADAYQGNGLGRQLMTRVMEKVDARYMVLTATQAGEPLYKKLGFEQYATIEQYQACLALSDVDNHCLTAAQSAWPDLIKRCAILRRQTGSGRCVT